MPLEVTGLVSSLTALNSLAKAMLGLRDATQLNPKIVEFQQAMIEANTRVLAVQQEHSELSARVQELEKENVRLKDWSAEKERYAPRLIAPGVFVCLKKDFVGDFESAQKLCCNCFEDGRTSILQQTNSRGARGYCILLKCSKCDTTLEFFSYNRESPPSPAHPAGPVTGFPN